MALVMIKTGAHLLGNLECRILLVDDEETFLEALSQRLEIRGLTVCSVASGEEALAQVEEQNFDVIVLDLCMPGIDGIETLKHLKEEDPDAEIIILTGHASVTSGIKAMKLGAEDFLTKPVDIGVLLETITVAKEKKMLVLEKKSQEEIRKIIINKGW